MNQTAWGTREGADDEDAYRMIRVRRKAQEAGSVDICSTAIMPSMSEKSIHRTLTTCEKCVEEH